MKKPVQNIRYSVQSRGWIRIMVHCGGDIAAHCEAFCSHDFVLRVVRQAAQRRRRFALAGHIARIIAMSGRPKR